MSDNPSVSVLNISEGQARYLEPPQYPQLTAEEQYHCNHLPHTAKPVFTDKLVASIYFRELHEKEQLARKRYPKAKDTLYKPPKRRKGRRAP